MDKKEKPKAELRGNVYAWTNEEGKAIEVRKDAFECYEPNPKNPEFICWNCYFIRYGKPIHFFMLMRRCSFCGRMAIPGGIRYPPEKEIAIQQATIKGTETDERENVIAELNITKDGIAWESKKKKCL